MPTVIVPLSVTTIRRMYGGPFTGIEDGWWINKNQPTRKEVSVADLMSLTTVFFVACNCKRQLKLNPVGWCQRNSFSHCIG